MGTPIRHKVYHNFGGIEDFVHNIPSTTCEQIIVNFKRKIITLSIEFSLPYVTRKCKWNSQLFCSFCRYVYANMLLSSELMKLWNVSRFYWALCITCFPISHKSDVFKDLQTQVWNFSSFIWCNQSFFFLSIYVKTKSFIYHSMNEFI